MVAYTCSGIQAKKVGFLFSNAAKICSFELKISKNIEINYVFQAKSFFITKTLSTQAPTGS